MVINRLVTTRQKKFLERTFTALGISIEDFMEVNNLIEFRKKTEEELAALRVENKFLTEVNMKQNEIIRDLNLRIEEINQRIDDLLYMNDNEAD
jgi:uncharacterized protein YydD (DUF2326 family)